MHPRLFIATAILWCLSPAVAQTPGSYVPFGTGCGSAATAPWLSAPKLPVIGREFVVSVRNVQPRTVGVLVFGGSNTRWNNTALPLSLAGFGAPGCKLYVSLDTNLLLGTGSGTAFLQVVLPRIQSLVGLSFYNQFLMPDSRANNAGLAVSNGAKATIGSCLCLPPESIVEDFKSDRMLDHQNSGGTWSGGQALAAQIGGTGRHGRFDYRIGRWSGSVFEWSTDMMIIPGTHTESGQREVIRNGLFHFSSMHVPAGVTVKFIGSNPAQIRVRGECRIDGRILVNGPDARFFMAWNGVSAPVAKGQPGSSGGPGGGTGGSGGDSCLNNGGRPACNGRAGSDVTLSNGHGYVVEAVGTGGKGSPYFPASGRISDYCALSKNFSAYLAAGGGGGGFDMPGAIGRVTRAACPGSKYRGSAPKSGGRAFPLVAFKPKTTGSDASLLHYMVGGSGAGGGGSHPLLTRKLPVQASYWISGSAGAGGGGILAFRIGQSFQMSSGSAIESRGGTGYLIDGTRRAGEGADNLFNMPSPGGGGSGGSILVQVVKSVTMNGKLDTSGGGPGILDNTPVRQPGLLSKTEGGRGSAGFFRVETVQGLNSNQLGTTVPTAVAGNAGKLTDHDIKVTSQSKNYNTGLSYSPYFLRYEIEAEIGGKKVLYSDDPTLTDPRFVGRAAAGQHVQFRIQGRKIDQRTGVQSWQGRWRDNVRKGLANSLWDDDANSWRFQLTHDRSAVVAIVVTSVTIWFRR